MGLIFLKLICMISFRCYVIVAPNVIRPATLYGVTVTILDNLRTDHPFISVRIEIRKDKLEITSATQNIPISSTQTLFLQVSMGQIYSLQGRHYLGKKEQTLKQNS
jgi:hypothetical protein